MAGESVRAIVEGAIVEADRSVDKCDRRRPAPPMFAHEVAEAQRLLADAEAENAVASLAVWRAMLAEAVLRGDLQPFLNSLRAPLPTVP